MHDFYAKSIVPDMIGLAMAEKSRLDGMNPFCAAKKVDLEAPCRFAEHKKVDLAT